MLQIAYLAGHEYKEYISPKVRIHPLFPGQVL